MNKTILPWSQTIALLLSALLVASANLLARTTHAQDVPPAQPPPDVAAQPPATPPAPEAPPSAAPTPEPVAPAAPVAPTPAEVPPTETNPKPMAPPEAAAEPAPEPEDVTKKPIDVHAWLRVDGILHGPKPKQVKHLTENVDTELHTDGQITKEIGLTLNLTALLGPAGSPADQGTVSVLDAIGRFDITDPFHIWVGRMLVPSDRANFSGTWFEAPWFYPGTYSAAGFIGPHEGPFGRNDGATVWGQFGGGLFKYYAGAFDLYDGTSSPLWSGRLNLSLLNPEPGYYHSSTYYGQDILAIGVGAQLKNKGASTATSTDDYAEFNADVLFEKALDGGAFDLEGAVYAYSGAAEPFKYSYLALISYLTPTAVGPGKLQPLVRLQQARLRLIDETETSIEAQLGYVIAAYSARLALGYQYTKALVDPMTGARSASNYIYLGAQFLK